MKNLSLLTVLLLTIGMGLLNAQTTQTNKGNVLIGVSSTLSIAGTGSDLMNIGFTSIKFKSDGQDDDSDTEKMTNINLLPKAGYFVSDNLAMGLNFNLAFSSSKNGDGDYKYTQTLFSTGPFIRYYIPTSKVLPYFELNSSFGSLKDKYEDDGGVEESKTGIMSFGGGVGIAAPLGDKVTLDFLAGYNSLTVKDKEDNEDNERMVIGTFGLKVGFTVMLGSN
ncbi:MAG: outer membrane beta-barrel protein [Bacteroidota bacterium]